MIIFEAACPLPGHLERRAVPLGPARDVPLLGTVFDYVGGAPAEQAALTPPPDDVAERRTKRPRVN